MRGLSLFAVVPVMLFALLRCGLAEVPDQVTPGVWFLLGDSSKGYSNTVVIEMRSYLIVVDANYPGRALELQRILPGLSRKPVRYVFDTHAHGDHSYGNAIWTHAGATTVAFAGVEQEMKRWEPGRWQAAMQKRSDMRATGDANVELPRRVIRGNRWVLSDGSREVDFLLLGWGHTPGDGFVWLPKEHLLCTGDAAVNGPRNKLWDADIAEWPKVLQRAIDLQPVKVLPGHGQMGGPEILAGQQRFLRDLYGAVADAIRRGETPSTMHITLPVRDANWVPGADSGGLSADVEATYREISEGAPMGSLPHVWR